MASNAFSNFRYYPKSKSTTYHFMASRNINRYFQGTYHPMETHKWQPISDNFKEMGIYHLPHHGNPAVATNIRHFQGIGNLPLTAPWHVVP